MNALQALSLPAPAGRIAAAAIWKLDPLRISTWLHWLAGRLGVAPHTLWQCVTIANFLAMAALLYWVMFRLKNWTLPGFLRRRGEQIQQKMSEAEAAHRQAESHYQAAQARLAGLELECRRVQEDSEREAQAEYQHLQEAARAEAEQVAARARQEIEAAARVARQNLRQYASELALQLAEAQARQKLTSEMDEQLVRQGLAELARQAPQA